MKQNKAIVFAVAALLVAYSGYRAATASFTHDESYSYLLFASGPLEEILIAGERPVSANNHLLNSLLMKLNASVFGTSELSLRLHSVLAHGLFLLFGSLQSVLPPSL